MARTTPSIANYDGQTVDEVTPRLRKLSQAELATLESYERQGRGRATVLARIAALRGETPWPGYDDMEADEVNDALKKRDRDTARAVLDYERQHKARTTIIEFAERKRDEAAGSAATTSRGNGAGKSESQARPSQRSKPSQPSSASKSKRASASSRRGSRDKPTARSSGAKARGSSRQGSSGGRTKAASKSRQTSSRSKSSSSAGSRSVSSSGTRPSRSAATKRAAPAAGARRAVGAAAKNSREIIGTAAQDTGHAVGTAAKKAKGPALTAGAVAVALGGGMMLRSKLLPKRTILGIPIPGRRSRLSQAAKSIGKARNGLLEAGNRADAIGKQVSAVNDEIQRIASGSPKD